MFHRGHRTTQRDFAGHTLVFRVTTSITEASGGVSRRRPRASSPSVMPAGVMVRCRGRVRRSGGRRGRRSSRRRRVRHRHGGGGVRGCGLGRRGGRRSAPIQKCGVHRPAGAARVARTARATLSARRRGTGAGSRNDGRGGGFGRRLRRGGLRRRARREGCEHCESQGPMGGTVDALHASWQKHAPCRYPHRVQTRGMASRALIPGAQQSMARSSPC